MLVSELGTAMAGRTERQLQTTLGLLELHDDASVLEVKSTGEEFVFDEQAERAISTYLGMNKSYLAKCPPDLKAHNINYWLAHKPEAPVVIEAINENLVTVHKPGLAILPLTPVVEIISRVFDQNHEVVNLIRDANTFHVDIVTDHSVEVRPDSRIEGRQEVGDITHGGVRILANPIEARPPQVLTYLHRLWCTNGSTSHQDEGTINIKGSTVEQVLESLELAARQAMGDLDNKLDAYADMANRRPPGSPTRFAYQLAREAKLPQRLTDRLIERVAILPEDCSIYDVQQIFTQLANGNVNYRTMTHLQHIGGDLAFNTDAVTHRCGQCERLLPGDD